MKILFLGGNCADNTADWLAQMGESITFRSDKVTLSDLEQILPELIISYNYKYILSKEMINFVNGQVINLHISYLPFNRGYYPNVWSFLDNTPKGVSIHYIDEGIDSGMILAQREIFIEEKETLQSSYDLLQHEIQKLFKEIWNDLKSGKIIAKPQTGEGSIHYKKERVLFESLIKEKGWDTPISELILTYKNRNRSLLMKGRYEKRV